MGADSRTPVAGRGGVSALKRDPIEEWDEDNRCRDCDGDGLVFGYELDAPLEYEPDTLYRCPNCGGSGKAEDMTSW